MRKSLPELTCNLEAVARAAVVSLARVNVVDRRWLVCWDNHAFFDIHGSLLQDDGLLNNDGLLDNNGRTSDPSGLHGRNDAFVHTLLVHRNDFSNLQLLLHSAGLDLIDDDGIAEATSAHGNDIIDGNGGLNLSKLLLLLSVDPLLRVVLSLLLLGGKFLVAGVTKYRATDDANRTANGSACASFIVVVTDQSADNGSA
jgi:hypothetical protein